MVKVMWLNTGQNPAGVLMVLTKCDITLLSANKTHPANVLYLVLTVLLVIY